MASSDRWYFTKEKLFDSPSRRCGIDAEKELSYRQQAANFIQDMGQRLQVTQLCINTAIVYMHRFYIFHSFSKFHRNAIAACAIFLAAKVEEQPRKLEHVIKVAHHCLNLKPNRTPAQLDVRSPEYARQANELVVNENIMLQTLGFDIAIEHPHTSVVKCCQLVRASKDLAQTSYFMATNSLHLTTMCLQYRPTVVACVCIHLACKWASWEIPVSNEGKAWFYYVDSTVTLDILERLTDEFLKILDDCPSRLRRKMLSGSGQTSTREPSLRTTAPSSVAKKDDKRVQDLKHSTTSAPTSSHSRFADLDNPLPSTSGNLPSGATTITSSSAMGSSLSNTTVMSSTTAKPDLNAHSKGARKDMSTGPPYSGNVTSFSSSSASSAPGIGNNVHSSQYDKKEAHSSYASYKDKKEMDRKCGLSNMQQSPSFTSSHVKSSTNPTPTTTQPHLGESKSAAHSYQSSSGASASGNSAATHGQSYLMTNDTHNKPCNSSNNETKQQQIAYEKQRLIEERSKIRNKPNENLWNGTKSSSHGTGSSVAALLNNGSHSKSQMSSDYANQAFYENLLNDNAGSIYGNSNSNSSGDSKHFKIDSLQSNDNEDSCDLIKRDSRNALKMEFSDNESNQSPTMNLTSISSLMMPEQSNGYMDSQHMDTKLHLSSQMSAKKETSFELKNHLDYGSLSSMLDYQLQQQMQSNLVNPLSKETVVLPKKTPIKNKTTVDSVAKPLSHKMMSSSSKPAVSQSQSHYLSHTMHNPNAIQHSSIQIQPKIKNGPKTSPNSNLATAVNSLSANPASANVPPQHPAYLSHSNFLPVSQNSLSSLSNAKTASLSNTIVSTANNLNNSTIGSNNHVATMPILNNNGNSHSLLHHASTAVPITAATVATSVMLDQSNSSLSGAQLPLLNQLPPPVALELPPLPSTFSTMKMKSEAPTNAFAVSSAPSSVLHATREPSIADHQHHHHHHQQQQQQQPPHSHHHHHHHHHHHQQQQQLELLQQEQAAALGASSMVMPDLSMVDTHKHSSKSKDKDKERSHEKHHKHHKEKKHKHKSKDKHKDKHKDKELKITLAVDNSASDDMTSTNNKSFRIKILKKPGTDEPSVATVSDDSSDHKKGLKITIPKASLSSSADRKRRNSPKESRSASKMCKMDDSM